MKVTLIARDPAGFKQVCFLHKETRQYYHVSVLTEGPEPFGSEWSHAVLRLAREDYRIIEGEHFDLVRQATQAGVEYLERNRQ